MRNSFTRLRTLAGSILAVVLAVAAFVPVAPNTVERSETFTPVSAGAFGHATHGFRPIESLEVGQRVLTGSTSDQDRATAVDPTSWKKLRLTATYHWNDGTPDTFHVTTLQSPEWMREHAAAIGAQVPMPLDVQEMGCPDGLLAEVESIELCPAIQDSPGRVILTTVRHLNSACRTLTVRAPDGTSEEIHTTDYHPFWSETKQGWVKAYTLSIGDQLLGLHGASLTLTGSQSIPGIHTVYYMTVEAEHVYRVGIQGVLVHNNCYDDAIAKQAKDGGEILQIRNPEMNRLGKRGPIPLPPNYVPAPTETTFSHAVNHIDGKIFDKANNTGMPYDEYFLRMDQASELAELPYEVVPWHVGMPQ